MFTVALIGPDGAGKTTVARELEHALEMPAKYLYMGVNWDASNHLLPTTRLVQAIRRGRKKATPVSEPPASLPAVTRSPGPARRILRAARSALSLANRIGEEWYRQLVAWSYVRRGVVVVFDRHFFSDYHAHDIAGGATRTLKRRIHGFLLSSIYPKPRLVVYLDAPAELLFARKGEGTLESLERRRQDYLELGAHMQNFITVDASRPLEEVVRNVAGAIESFAESNSSTRSATNGHATNGHP